MKQPIILLFTLITTFFLTGCKTSGSFMHQEKAFLKEGHRGARGLMPENTIPAMLKALDLQVDVLEMDVQVSKDGKVFLAHDHYINSTISTLPAAGMISEKEEKNFIWHQMNYEDIRKIDVGRRGHPGFPRQQKMEAYMPLLEELIDTVEAYVSRNGITAPFYNIELKATPGFDGTYQPAPALFVESVMKVLSQKKIESRTHIQSFDSRQLQELHKTYPDMFAVFLTESEKASLINDIKTLGFTPDGYSPYYKLVTPAMIKEARNKNIKLIPWTVNDLTEMKHLISMGVDGVITDYPDLFKDL